MLLSQFKVLSFDCYGTLIDWETGITSALEPLTRRVSPALTQQQILEAHAAHEHSQQLQTPARLYRELLPVVYKRLAEQWGVHVTHEECAAYGRSIGNWPAFADSRAALQYLKKFYKLVIVSNVDNQSFAATSKQLGVVFDAVITAEDAGFYKPSRKIFEYMLERLGRGLGYGPIARQDILHTAESLFHDHAPANHFGLASCWISRRPESQGFGATVAPRANPTYDFRFDSVAALAEAHRNLSVIDMQ